MKLLLLLSTLILSCSASTVNTNQSKCLIDSSSAEKIIEFLKRAVPEYKIKTNEDFMFDKAHCFIKRVAFHDLTNTAVINTFSDRNRFRFENNHIYHFYIVDAQLAFSHILYIDKDGLFTFFETINCKNRGNTLPEVTEFLLNELAANPQKDEIVERVRNYRRYYVSAAIDDIKVSLKCECEPCD